MAFRLLFFFLFIAGVGIAQQPYYNDVNLNTTGQALYQELQNKIDNASSIFNYDDVKDVFRVTDENPQNTNDVLLLYGYNDSDGDCTNDRSRDKDDFGGGACEYNREHTFPRSLANPSMGDVGSSTTGIGADPHNLRPTDVQTNGNRGNKKFGNGSGTAGNVGSGNWYPGDEWKGDVARMMMYMYTRYGNRCLPSLVGTGPTQNGTAMLQLFLEWNAEDPVSALEDQRNPHLEMVYGNRNPFIDNPYLATLIWGGPAAEDRWGILALPQLQQPTVSVYPNPASGTLWIQNSTHSVETQYYLHDVGGRVVLEGSAHLASYELDISKLNSGVYLLSVVVDGAPIVKRIVVE